MRLLLHNPNANTELTAALGRSLAQVLAPGDELRLATAGQGPQFIGSNETIAAARALLWRDLPALSAPADAVLLGCFGDLGTAPLQAAIGKPVVSLWEAGLDRVRQRGRRIGVLTTSFFWAERIRLSFGPIVAPSPLDVTVVETPSDASEADRVAAITRAIARLAERDAADEVMLGGALLSAFAPRLDEAALPIVDLFGSAVDLCRSDRARATDAP